MTVAAAAATAAAAAAAGACQMEHLCMEERWVACKCAGGVYYMKSVNVQGRLTYYMKSVNMQGGFIT